MSIGRKLVKGSLLRNLEFFTMVAVTLVMTPYIIHSLGDRLYGFWCFIGAFIGYYGLLDFGMTSAISRFISQGIGRKDMDDVSKVASTSIVLMFGIGLVALLVTLGAVALCPIFLADPQEISLFRSIILLLGASVACSFPARVYGAILSSHLRYDFIITVTIVRILATNGLIYYFLGLGHGLLTITLINVGGNLIQYVALWLYCHFQYREIRITPKAFEKGKIRSFLNYSSKTFVAQIADILRFRIDSLVIVGFLNLSQVTYFSVGARLMDYFVQFVGSTMGTVAPLYSQYEGSGNMDAVRTLFEKATKIGVILSLFVGTSILFYGKPFIHRWMGPEFASSYTVVTILASAYILSLMQTSTVSMLYGISKHQFFAMTSLAEGVLNLLLSIILVRFYGIYGVALGTAISLAFFKMFVQPIYACRCVDYPLGRYYLKTLGVTALKVMLPLGIFYYLLQGQVQVSYGSIIGYAALQTTLFVPWAFFIVLNSDERTFLKQAIVGKTCT